MKSEINLLPIDIRNARIARIRDKRISALFYSFIGVLVLLCAVYGLVWQNLRTHLAEINSRLVFEGADRAEVEKSIRGVNEIMSAMSQQVDLYPRWVIHAEDVLNIVPSGIAITKFELVENPATLVITGKSSSGSLVVEYQRALEELPWVDHVLVPLQNFARSPEAIVTFTVFRKEVKKGDV